MRLKAKLLIGVVATALVGQAPVPFNAWASPASAQVQVQGLPNVADLVEKLLPAVVEISVQHQRVALMVLPPRRLKIRHSRTSLTNF
jgi:S1-C subfamily serine protease